MQVAEFFATLGIFVNTASFAAGEKALGGIRGGVTKLGAAIGGALGIDALKEMVTSTVELGSKLNDTAQKTGLSTDALQFLGYAAKLNSGSMDGVAFAANKMNRNLIEAEKGTGEAKDALVALGISANDPAFKNLTVEAKFQRISAELAKLPDGSKKSALAMQIFGRSGAELIPTINDLGKNGAKLREEFEAFGGGLSKDQTEALDDFGDNVDRLKTQLGQLKDQAVVTVLPLLAKGLEGLSNWIKENRQTIQQGISSALSAVITVMKALGETFVFFSKHKDVLAVLAAVGAAFYAWFNPVQAVIIAIIAIIHYWPQISAAARAAWLAVRNAVGEAWDYIKSIPDKISDAFAKAWESTKDAAKEALEWVANLPVVKQLIEIYKYFTTRTAAQQAASAASTSAQANLDRARASGDGRAIAKAQVDFDKAAQQQAGAYGTNVGVGAAFSEIRSQQDQTTLAAVGGGGNTVITSVGDINVQVPPGSDADGIGRIVAAHVQQVINQAHDAVRGGVR